jgi:hypothetical protein
MFPQHEAEMLLIELTNFLILRKPRSGCLEERTAPIQPVSIST